MSKQAAFRGATTRSPLAALLLPVITQNGHLRSSVVLLQVEWQHHKGDWADVRKQLMELLTRSIRAGGDLLLPTLGGEEKRESFFILASTDLEHAQVILRRIRERLSDLPGLASPGTVTVSAKGIWLPTRSGDALLSELTEQVAERITRLAKLSE